MVAFEAVDSFEGGRCEFGAKAWEDRLFFVRGVAFAAGAEVLERGEDGGLLFGGEGALVGSLGDQAEEVEEALDSAVAVFQHANGIVEAAVGFGAYLYGQGSACFHGSVARGATPYKTASVRRSQ